LAKLKQKYEQETKSLDHDIRVLLAGTDIEKIQFIKLKYKVSDDIEKLIWQGNTTQEASFSGIIGLFR
jgi:hypothetical protein